MNEDNEEKLIVYFLYLSAFPSYCNHQCTLHCTRLDCSVGSDELSSTLFNKGVTITIAATVTVTVDVTVTVVAVVMIVSCVIFLTSIIISKRVLIVITLTISIIFVIAIITLL